MSDQPHAGPEQRRRSNRTTRRRFLAALGTGSLVGPARHACEDSPAEPREGAMLVTEHEVRIGFRTTEVPVAVPEAHYQRVTDSEHSFSETFAAAQHQSYLEPVAADIAERASDRASAIRAVQSLTARITYATDHASTGKREFVRYPAETLVDGCGDCEDKAILLAGLLGRSPLDCRTALLVVPNHCATLAVRADLPRDIVAADPLSVTLHDTEYIYVEAVDAVQPGKATLDYGDLPHVAAYDGDWTVLNVDALLGWSRELFDRHGFDLVRDATE